MKLSAVQIAARPTRFGNTTPETAPFQEKTPGVWAEVVRANPSDPRGILDSTVAWIKAMEAKMAEDPTATVGQIARDALNESNGHKLSGLQVGVLADLAQHVWQHGEELHTVYQATRFNTAYRDPKAFPNGIDPNTPALLEIKTALRHGKIEFGKTYTLSGLSVKVSSIAIQPQQDGTVHLIIPGVQDPMSTFHNPIDVTVIVNPETGEIGPYNRTFGLDGTKKLLDDTLA